VRAVEREGTVGIAVDGSVYHKYPKFRARLHVALAAALEPLHGTLAAPPAVSADLGISADAVDAPAFSVQFVDAANGSCFGAAVIAATASQCEAAARTADGGSVTHARPSGGSAAAAGVATSGPAADSCMPESAGTTEGGLRQRRLAADAADSADRGTCASSTAAPPVDT
jgi:Hexokinase